MSQDAHPTTLPLQGVRVVEFGNLVAAPFCGMLLADLGADVVKVEPIEGDMSRELGPFWKDESGFFLSVNRGKRSMAIDVREPAAHRWVIELIGKSDVLLHNFRKGVAERLGLGYDDLAPSNPSLVYCAISAFGPQGPESDRAGIDLIFQGESGMIGITGEVGQDPQKTATNVADVYAGTNAALSISAALAGPERRGRKIDVSLRDGLIAMQATWNALYFATRRQPPRVGTASPFTAPTQAFRTSDGWLLLAIVSDKHWHLLCDILELGEDVTRDPDFSTNDLRGANRERLAGIVGSVLETDTTESWLDRLENAGLPAGRIMTFEEVFTDPQVMVSEMEVTYQHARVGPVTVQGSPLWVDGDKAISSRPPPALGQHSREVLSALGCSDAELTELLAGGLLAEPRA